MDVMKVICKECGAENEKAPEDYSCICTECGFETYYFVRSRLKKNIVGVP